MTTHRFYRQRQRALHLGVWLACGLLVPGAGFAQDAVPAPVAGTAPTLDVATLIEQVLQNNKTVRSKRTERDITATSIERANAAFQPQATLSALRGMSSQKNTYEEELIRQTGLGVYQRDGNDYNVGISKLFANGAKVEMKTSLSRFVTNNIQPTRPDGVKDNRSGVSWSVTQPLARDAGTEVTLARTRVAQLDTTVADHASRDTDLNVALEAIHLYYDLWLAQAKVESAQDKIRSGERLLGEVQALFKQGRLPESDVWEVENALARFRSGLSEAKQNEAERQTRMQTLLLQNPAQAQAWRVPADLPSFATQTVDMSQALQMALERRDDLLMRKVQAQREEVQLAYSSNQALPRVDLVASYGVSGLEYAAQRSLDWSRMRDYPVWSVGVQMAMPLGENQQAKADIAAANARREDAWLAVQALEVQINNDIQNSVTLKNSVLERWALWQEIAQREAKQLALEKQKFAAGRSDTREVLLREERVVNARVSVQEQQAALFKADALLQASQGVLLDGFR